MQTLNRFTAPALVAAAVATFAPITAFAQSSLNIPINCTINPERVINLSSEIPGVLDKVHVAPGSSVKKGDLLMELDSDLVRADLELARKRAGFTALVKAAQRRAAQLEKRLTRMKRAQTRNAVSQSEFDEVEREYEIARTDIEVQTQELDLAQSNLNRTQFLLEKSRIESPEDGIIGEDLASAGEAVGSDPVATLYVVKRLRVEAFVPTALLPQLQASETVSIIVNGNRNKPVPVKLDYISSVAKLASNTISAYFVLDAPEIIPGYKCLLKLG